MGPLWGPTARACPVRRGLEARQAGAAAVQVRPPGGRRYPVERLRALLRRGEGRGGTSCPASAPHLVRGYYDSSEAIAYAPLRHSLPRLRRALSRSTG